MFQFEIGDLVCVDSDMARAKDLQQDHGGWARGMERVRIADLTQHLQAEVLSTEK